MSIESTALNVPGLHKAHNIIAKMLSDSGKDITVEHFKKNGIPSLLAYKGKTRPANFRVILGGHLDVVPASPELFKATIKDGKLYGRGSHDMKAAAVILTDAFCEFVDKTPYPLGLQIVTDEENGGHNGAKYQVDSGVRGDFVICGECGRKNDRYEIANEAKGIAVINIEFAGTSAHGAYLWRGENAILRAMRFAEAILKRYPVPTEEVTHTTVNVFSLSTNNTAYSKVPDHAALKLDVRFVPDDPNFRTKQHVASLIEEIDPQARITEFINFEAPIYTNPENPLLLQLKAAAEKVEGHTFNYVRRNATSDGRFFASKGDQACEFGIAGEDQHGNNEHITLKAFENYRKTMHTFLKQTIKTEAKNINTQAFMAD